MKVMPFLGICQGVSFSVRLLGHEHDFTQAASDEDRRDPWTG
jgi:hypothetical protein